MTRRAWRLLVALALLSGAMGGIESVAATELPLNAWYVDDDGLASAGDCDGTDPDFANSTINTALVGAHLNGGFKTVVICPGTYREQLQITKNITLLGVDDPVVEAPDVLVDNVPDAIDVDREIRSVIWVQGAANAAIDGLVVDGRSLGATNMNLAGITFFGSSGTIQNNEVKNMKDNPVSSEHRGAGILVTHKWNAVVPQSVTISNNNVHDVQKTGISINEPETVATVDGNTIVGPGVLGQVPGAGVQVAFGASGFVTDNTITAHSYNQIDGVSAGIFSEYSGTPPQTTLEVTGNTIGANAVGLLNAGMNVTAHQNSITGNDTGMSSDVTLNATDNWWGTKNGPAHPDNHFNLFHGEVIEGPVTYVPWLDAATNGASFAPVTNDSGDSFSSLALAETGTPAGGIITAKAGSFGEAVVVDKQLTLRGAQHGVDARTRDADDSDETVLDSLAGAFQVDADGVKIDGFKMTGASTGDGISIDVSASSSATEILNNIVRANTTGLNLNADSVVQPTLVKKNSFADNSGPGAAGGHDIHSDTSLANATIDNNEFSGSTASLVIAGSAADLTFSDNEVESDGPVVIKNTDVGSLSGNSITSDTTGVLLDGGNDEVTIMDNMISGGTGSGVALTDAGTNEQTSIIGNDLSSHVFGVHAALGSHDGLEIHGNDLSDSSTAAIHNAATTAVDAEGNWFGTKSGPVHAGNTYNQTTQAGVISESPGVIDYVPWQGSLGGSNFAPVTNNDIQNESYSSIGAAVTDTESAGTIDAAAGTFTETVVANKSLTIRGAQHGVHARTRVAPAPAVPETVMNGPGGGFHLTADNVTIDGFTITNGTEPLIEAGVKTSGSKSGHQIANNIITNNAVGMFFDGTAAPGDAQNVVERNVISGNNNPGALPAPAFQNTGIYSDGGLKDALIRDNHFTQHNQFGGRFIAPAPVGLDPFNQQNISFKDNTATNGRPFVFINTEGLQISGNTLTGTTGNAIALTGNNPNPSITGNTITGGNSSAIALSGATHQSVTITGNTLTGNVTGINLASGSNDGAEIHNNNLANNLTGLSNGDTSDVDAENNWWGTKNGPNHASNKYGVGTQGSPLTGTQAGRVDFLPWLDAATNGNEFAPVTTSESENYASLQTAIAETGSGGTITAQAGTFGETVTVSKTLTLKGAQFGVNPALETPRAGDETIVSSAGGGFIADADGVSIDGFTVQGATNNPGISLLGTRTGHKVENNIIKNNTYGMALNGTNLVRNTVRRNLFQTNNVAGTNTGRAIYSGTNLTNALIQENRFTGHQNGSITLVGSPFQVTVDKNTLQDDHRISVLNGSQVQITGNTSDDSLDSAIYLGGGNTAITIKRNKITDSAQSGIHLGSEVASPNLVEVAENHLSGNAQGIKLDDNSHTGGTSVTIHHNRIVDNDSGVTNHDEVLVSAQNNWWGCNAGPTDGDCDPSMNADTEPWLVMNLLVEPTTIGSDGSTTLTVDLTKNNEEQDTSSAGVLPRGTSVTFNDGTSYEAVSELVDGIATTIFTPDGSVETPRTMTALYDTQTVQFTELIVTPPVITIDDASITEGAGPANFTLHLSTPIDEAVTVDYTATSGTALEGSDFTSPTGTATILANETTQTISIPVQDDLTDEASESFTVQLSNPTKATLGTPSSATGTINDNDPAPTLKITDPKVVEGKTASVKVTISRASSLPISISYATENDTASAGSDYVTKGGTLSFSPGQTSKQIQIKTVNNNKKEPQEKFNVRFANAVGLSAGDRLSRVTINDND